MNIIYPISEPFQPLSYSFRPSPVPRTFLPESDQTKLTLRVFDRGPTDACTPARVCCCLPNVNYCDRTSRKQITQKPFCVLDAVRGIKRRTHNSLLTILLRRLSRCERQRVAFQDRCVLDGCLNNPGRNLKQSEEQS